MRPALLCAALLPTLALASADAPISLTASDGTGLKLVSLQARAVVSDPLAFTELTLVFENPLDRVIEGQFKVTLPQGAALSRFAMKLDERWQEGEVVEKQAARRAYDDFLHRRQDPALLEQNAGNEFTAKVFPIAARGKKELILSYSHELTQAGAPYVLPLKGLPEVGTLDVKVSGVTGDGVLHKTNFVPNADFQGAPVTHQAGVRSGDLLVARVVPVAATAADPLTDFTLLVDSSASRALGWPAEVALVKQLLAAMPTATVRVVAFDQDVQALYAGVASGFGDAQLKQLKDRRALGASDVERALQYLAKNPSPRAVLLSDGVFTAGVIEGPNLTAQVLKLKAAGVQRVDAIALGGLRDDVSLARLTAGSLARDGAVLDGDLPVVELTRRLSLATRSKLKVTLEGATSVWPTQLDGIQAGDAVLLTAQLPASAPVKGSIGGAPFSLAAGTLASVERPLLERAFARARIAQLERQLEAADGPKERAALKEKIVDVSTKQRVLSSQTALLVLETEADYARFDIDRRALTDVLVVENGHVVSKHRAADSVVATKLAAPKKPVARADDEKAKEKKEAKPDDDAAEAAGPGAPADGELATGAEAPKAEPAAAPAPEPMADVAPAPPPPPPPSPSRARESREEAPATAARGAVSRSSPRGVRNDAPPKGADPYTGPFKAVMDALKTDKPKGLALARCWHEEAPGDLLALVALGEALEATGDEATAARAYGSIIDLFPGRADLRRFAGVRLERLAAGLALATDTFEKAAEQRGDHPASHRLLAFALLRAGQPEKAFAAIARGLARSYPEGRFAGVRQILSEDAGLVAAAWIKAEPTRKAEILSKLEAAGGTVENAPSLRFVLNWETDANDVDFHITDAKGNHAYYSEKHLASGGDLYADVTTGYGPECFTIRLPREKRAAPYTLQAHYYSIGPMGAGMGKLELIEHDGHGGLRFEERPYVVMVNQAFVDLGTVK